MTVISYLSFAESEASWEEWWTYDGISGERFFCLNWRNELLHELNFFASQCLTPVRYFYWNFLRWKTRHIKYAKFLLVFLLFNYLFSSSTNVRSAHIFCGCYVLCDNFRVISFFFFGGRGVGVSVMLPGVIDEVGNLTGSLVLKFVHFTQNVRNFTIKYQALRDVNSGINITPTHTMSSARTKRYYENLKLIL